jgi:hypothetical protein
MESLAVCASVLYDKDYLDKIKQFKVLEKENNVLKKKLKYFYVKNYWDFHDTKKNLTFQDLEFYYEKHNVTKHILMYICDKLKMKYTFVDNKKDLAISYKFPYQHCVQDDCDLVFLWTESEKQMIYGKRFWDAKTVENQLKVYMWMYTVDNITYWDSFRSVKNIVDFSIDPYMQKNSQTYVPEEIVTFEQWYGVNEIFSLEHIYDILNSEMCDDKDEE